MGGAYARVSSLAASSPSPLFASFLERLRGAIRDDIADCAVVAYPSLSAKDACVLLGLTGGETELRAYISMRREKGAGDFKWSGIENGSMTFSKLDSGGGGGESGGGNKQGVDASQLMAHALHYANEIERIV
jgi:hypothetical protein